MSKKKFTAGLESLFGDAPEDLFRKEETPSPEEKKKERKSRSDGEDRPASGKDFTSDLQSFLEESFEESLERQLKDSGRPATQTRKRRRPSGLDMLIQRTVDEAARQPESPHHGLGKRITLLLDQEKLDKLKVIARQERTYLRNIIDDIVAEYIDTYEERKGKLD